MAEGFLIIDGGMLEGGGQILRNAAALSSLLNKPIRVNNIRAGRSNPGLRPQHLTGLNLIKQICSGDLKGAQVSGSEITLVPACIRKGVYQADTKTAGSICLLIQAALPCLFYADGPVSLNLRGGTNADMAPQIDFFTLVFKSVAEKFGVTFDCDIRKRGYYPKGGGQVLVNTSAVKHLSPVDLTDVGQVTRIFGRSFVAGVLPMKVAHIMATVAKSVISKDKNYRNIPIDMEVVKEPEHAAFGTGTGIIVIAETSTGCRLSGSALGKKGVAAEQVGQTAADMLLDNLYHGGCVDDFTQDQIIILMALAKGTSRVKCGQISLHTETAVHIAQELTQAKFKVEKISETNHMIECEGIGLINQHF